MPNLMHVSSIFLKLQAVNKVALVLAYPRVNIGGGLGGGVGPPLESSQPPLQTQDKKVRGVGFRPPSSDSCESTY